MNKALFLDRDGTINIDHGYVHEEKLFDFIPGIFDFCREARCLGYIIIVITNQSGIARGFYSEADYLKLTEFMLGQFARHGVIITEVLHCPLLDGPDRKPAPGLFHKAQVKYQIDMSASINIGDSPRDIEAGEKAGVGTNLLFSGDYALLRPYLVKPHALRSAPPPDGMMYATQPR